MARRKQRTPTDSLDMLLDTITNAFGGIVLLALLVALIIGQQAPYRTDRGNQQQSVEIVELQRQKEDLVRQHESLESTIEGYRQLVDQFRDQQAEGIVDELLEMQNKELQLVQLHELQTRQLTERQGMIRDLQKALKQVEDAVQSSKAEMLELEAAIQQEKQRRVRIMDLPLERPTFKSMVVFLVKGGELFVLDEQRGESLRPKINEQHFRSCTESQADLILASPTRPLKVVAGAGIPLTDDETLLAELKQYPSDNVFATIVVWSDSFDNFGHLRDACVAHSLEHKLIPIVKGPVREGPGSGPNTAQ